MQRRKNQATVILLVIFSMACATLQVPTPTSTPRPTRTQEPTPTATPGFDLPPVIITDQFEDNKNRWAASHGYSLVQVKDGKLYLSSSDEENSAFAMCWNCRAFSDNFYYEAQVRLAEQAGTLYGIQFCMSFQDGVGDSAYIFMIDPETDEFILTKSLPENTWIDLETGVHPEMKKYPEVNKLGVRFDHGQIDLFINDVAVVAYKDFEYLEFGTIGFFVADYGPTLIADNVDAYEVGPEAPTPVQGRWPGPLLRSTR